MVCVRTCSAISDQFLLLFGHFHAVIVEVSRGVYLVLFLGNLAKCMLKPGIGETMVL